MAKTKVQFSGGDLDNVVEKANEYLKSKRGWMPIQLTYGCHKDVHIIAFTAVSKADGKTRKFIKSETFDGITGNQPIGIFYVEDQPFFVGVPN